MQYIHEHVWHAFCAENTIEAQSIAGPLRKRSTELWLLATGKILLGRGTLMESVQAPDATDPDPT